MKLHESSITETERVILEKSMQPGESEIQQSDSSRPYFHTKEDLETTAKSLDESKEQIKELMKSLQTSLAPQDKQLIVRCMKEIRESMKVKLDIAKFAHVIGPKNLATKGTKETA